MKIKALKDDDKPERIESIWQIVVLQAINE
jgi:hypothetical protein